MQKDTDFYSRYFAGLFVYLHQYKISRTWRGLLIFNSRSQNIGSEIPYQDLLNHRVQRLYLEDLLIQENLSPNLALLKLIVISDSDALSQAQQILNSATTQAEFQLKLDLIEAILVNKFPSLNISEVQKMLNLREADVTQTRFYQEVLQIGRQEGVQIGRQEGVQIGRQEGTQQGEASLLIRMLTRRCGNLNPSQLQKVRSLSIDQLEFLCESLLDFQDISDLDNWLNYSP
jgi:predicted transposase YdaD